jgi:hypothetical protein
MSENKNMTAAQIVAKVEQDFDDACMKAVLAGEKQGYSASVFLEMRERYGMREAARRVMQGKRVPYGFRKLAQMKRLDLTVEVIVHENPQFQQLFTQKTLDYCTARLRAVGYKLRE